MPARHEIKDEEQRNLRMNTNVSRISSRREAEDEKQMNLGRNTNASRMAARQEAEDEEQDTKRMCRWTLGACFECGEIGHRISECKKEKVVKCYRCGISEHTASECRSNRINVFYGNCGNGVDEMDELLTEISEILGPDDSEVDRIVHDISDDRSIEGNRNRTMNDSDMEELNKREYEGPVTQSRGPVPDCDWVMKKSGVLVLIM
ncbi:uncharacterized protein [Palaemon carinicauda]|uniref:uncharacterized protein n=1 Tax=Palaemon carinicauda TaxID=392227 RepID=UPI0035B68CC7